MCRRTKVTRRHAKKKLDDRAARNKIAERFGDVITADHKVLNAGQESRLHYRHAVVVQDLSGTMLIEVQVPSQQPGNSKSWVRISRGIEQYARQSILTETDHQHLEAASSQAEISCGRPRAQDTGGPSRVIRGAEPKPKLTPIGFQSASLENDPSKSGNQKGIWNS